MRRLNISTISKNTLLNTYMCELLKDLANLVGKGESDGLDSLFDVLNHRNVHVPVEVREKLFYCVEQVRDFSVRPFGS